MVGAILLQVLEEPSHVIDVAVRSLAYAGWLAAVGLMLFFAAIDRTPALTERSGPRTAVWSLAALAAAAGLAEALGGAGDAAAFEDTARWLRVVVPVVVGGMGLWGTPTATRWGAGLGCAGLAFWTAGSRAVDAGDVVAAVSDWLHLVAAAAWIGVLAGLLVSRTADGPVAAVRPEAVRRIQDASMVALVSVFALALTGLIQAVAFLDAWTDLVATAYGRTLVVKLVLVGVALALGGLNRLVFLPKIERRTPLSLRALRNAVMLEFVVLMGVVAATALLVHLPI